jgi:ketosteroid isomerase-like protein
MSSVLALVLLGCDSDDCPPSISLSAADTARIEEEVRQALDDYAASVVAGDQEQMEAFWGDFDDFIHAGDGRVFGDREAWIAWMASNPPDGIVSWEFSEVHVAVLGAEAASYTANFELVTVVDGAESTPTGSWTYVLRKTDEGWRVVQSNGKHNDFSYYDQSG